MAEQFGVGDRVALRRVLEARRVLVGKVIEIGWALEIGQMIVVRWHLASGTTDVRFGVDHAREHLARVEWYRPKWYQGRRVREIRAGRDAG
jgi:hypothetical protein